MWERGLKLRYTQKYILGLVAPHVGAWIEIIDGYDPYTNTTVAPHVGAWIEIPHQPEQPKTNLPSLPMWERGLKSSLTG